MRIYRVAPENARNVTAFGSNGAEITPILRNISGCHVSYLKLTGGGELGLHPAVGEQVFLVLEGEGWVEGERGNVQLSKLEKPHCGWTVRTIVPVRSMG